MQVSHMLSFFKWTPRNIFVLCFLCCIVVANAAEVDSRFDSGSRSLALKWQGLKGSLPHNKIPSEADQIKDTGKWAMPYAKSMAPIIGPGFVIALLTLLAGVIYGIFKIIRLCVRKICCNSEESDEESASDSSEDDSNGNFMHIWCPTIVYCVCFVFLLTGMIFGILNNPRFSEGVNDMGTSVVAVGTDAVGLGNGLLDGVDNIVAQIPNTIKGIDDQFTGVNPLADDVTDISQDVNGTSTQMNNITNEIASINAGNTHALDSLNAELASINIQSKTVASQMADLTNQLAVDLRNTLNNTLGSLDEKVGEIDDTVADLKDTAKGIIDQAKDLVDKVIKYVDDGKSYDRTRAKAVKALFIVVILVAFAIILGYILKFKFIFNIIAALFFVFLFFLWFFGALHFVLGMALYDSCPVMDVAVQGLLPKDSQPANVLTGCLYEHRTVLQSMNVSAYNLSDVFDYKSDFQNFANFSKNFNFSSIDSYFASIKNLTNYNLTAVADNLTVASYGWNETKIYDALDVLNQATTPDYFDLSNYTTADPTNYAAPNNQTVYDTKLSITNMVEVNRTVYNETAVAKQQLYQAQQDINNLVDSVNVIQGRFDGVQTEMRTLETKNITNCIAVIDLLQSNITAFFQSGNCSFLGDTYVNIRESLCNTMQPAIDLLTVATFLAGIALIPMVIIAEVLSFRIPKARSIYPTCNNDDNSDTEMQEPHEKKLARQGSIKKDGKEYTATLTDSPKPRSRRFEGFTASTTAAPPSGSHAMDGSYSSSPDFNDHRRVIEEHYASRTDI